MEPIVAYSTSSIEWKSEFMLFHDAVVVRHHQRGFPSRSFAHSFPLVTLDPKWSSFKFRRRTYWPAGIFFLIFTLLVITRAWHSILWDLPVVIPLLGIVLWFMFAGAGVVEYAEFRTRNGDGKFRIPADRDRGRFENFIHALTNQIQIASKTA